MNSVIISAMISLFFVLIKMAVNYKESPSPNIKDGLFVFLSSLVGLHASEYLGKSTPKVMNVFTETPSF